MAGGGDGDQRCAAPLSLPTQLTRQRQRWRVTPRRCRCSDTVAPLGSITRNTRLIHEAGRRCCYRLRLLQLSPVAAALLLLLLLLALLLLLL